MAFAPIFDAWLQPVEGNLAQACIVLFAMIIGHMMADFPLQGEFLAVGKNRHDNLKRITGQDWPQSIWVYCLTAHSLIHSGVVWILSGCVLFAIAEFFLHWVIDLMKAEKFTNFYVDQALHIVCKMVYVALFYFGAAGV